MIITIKYQLFIILMLLPIGLNGQHHQQYIEPGIGLGFSKNLDYGLSPLVYKGIGWISSVGYFHPSNKILYHFQFDLGFAEMVNELASDLSNSKEEIYSPTLAFHTWWNTKYLNNNILKLGFAWTNTEYTIKHSEYVNNGYQLNFISSLGPSLFFVRKLVPNIPALTIRFQADAAIIGTFIRPSFASAKPYGFLNNENNLVKKSLSSFKVSTVDNFQQFNFKSGLQYKFWKENMLSLSYSWQFSHINVENEVFWVQHSLMLTCLIAL